MSIKKDYQIDKLNQQQGIGEDLNKNELIFRNDLISHIQQTINYYEKRNFTKWIEVYKYYNLFSGDEKAKAKALDMEWRESSQFPLIKMIVDTLFSSLYDSEVKFKVLPRNSEDVEKSDKFQSLVNWLFDNANIRKRFYEAMKEALLIGISFVKVGFNIEQKEIVFNKKGKKVVKKYTEYEPIVENVSPFNLFVDPYAQKIDDARYIIHRRILPISVALREFKDIVKLNKDQINRIKKDPKYISTRDYNIINKIQYYSDIYAEWANSYIDSGLDPNEIIKELENIDFLNFFNILNTNNDLVEVVEYYKGKKYLIMINGYIVYDGYTTYATDGYPFVNINYEVGGGLFSKGVGVNLLDFQKISSLIFNTNIDSIKLSISPMFEANMHTLQEDFDGDYFKVEPFKIIRTKGEGGALKPLTLIQPNQLGLDTITKIIQFIENSEGPNQYSMGGAPVERSATGASLKAQIVKQRLKPLLDNVNESLTELMKKMGMIILNKLDHSEKQTLSLRVDNEFGEVSFINLDIEDIVGQYDIILELNSLKSTTTDIEKHQILEFLQTALQTVDQDPIKGRPLIDREVLLKKLVNLYNLPNNVILTDDRFEKKQVKNIKTKKDLQNKIQKVSGNSNNEKGNITPEQLAELAKQGGGTNQQQRFDEITPEEAIQAAEKEQQREMQKEAYQLNPQGKILKRGMNYFI